jgi:hypothetical protein
MTKSLKPLIAMQGLWEKTNDYLQQNGTDHVQYGILIKVATTPGELNIERIENRIRLEATFEKNVGFTACDVTVRVQYSDNLRQLPAVHEEWVTENGSGISTVPERRFPEVAEDLADLINSDWIEADLAT